jgi:Uma2 family endonuclease
MSAVYTPKRTLISNARYQKMIAAGVFTKDDRIELIEGEMLDMSPMGAPHISVVTRLIRLFTSRLSEQEAHVTSGVPVNLGDFSEPQSDLLLLKPRADFYGSKVPEAQDVLLLVEVSDSTLAFDQGEKLRLYARYSVTEYWVVDVNKQLVVRYLDPTVQGYAREEEYKGADALSVKAFPQLLIAVKDILG